MRTRLYLASAAALADEALFQRLLPAVPAQRQERIGRCRSAAQRRLLLGAGLLLNVALADEGLRAADYEVMPGGRPRIPSLPQFHFSLSHSGETVLCSVSGREIGCDAERLRPFDTALAGRFFHSEESAELFALPEEERQEAFFRLWTLKESYMKALGRGFALPMSAFAVSLRGPRLTRPADERGWRLSSFREGDCLCALCQEEADGEAQLIRTGLEASPE